jgi:pilus assembly protein FimV
MLVRACWIISLLVLPFSARALGLGAISLNSSLDQPLSAEIELLSPEPVELDDIQVSLAGVEVFEKAGLDRPFLLTELRFLPQLGKDGNLYIRVGSRQAIREPYLNFLVEVSWSGGRLLKEYTVLLDPPVVQPPLGAATVKPKAEKVALITQQDRVTTYGPVKTADTLWAIATNTRPDRSFSVEQMMIALLRANPAAFRHGNVNFLQHGMVLHIPDPELIAELSAAAARAEFARQTRDWREMRNRSAGVSPPIPASGRVLDARAEPEQSQAPLVRSRPVSDVPEFDRATDSTVQAAEAEEKPLRVVAPVKQWRVEDPGESNFTYPAEDEEKLREAIADSKQDLLAVQEINHDLEALQDALEKQIKALQQSLQEKDQAISRLKQRAVTKATQLDSAERGKGIELTSSTEPGIPDVGHATQPAVEMTPVPLIIQPEPDTAPRQTALHWLQANWLLLLVAGLLVLLGLMARVRSRRAAVAASPEVNSFRSFMELDQEPPGFVASELTADSFRSYTDEQELFPEVGEDVASVLTKADIYLAYRQYDQAVSLVRESITSNPGNRTLQAKLLEIYAFRKDKAAFVQLLEEVHAEMSRQEPAIWDKVVAIGLDLVPDHPLIRAAQRSGSSREDSAEDQLLALEGTHASSLVAPDEVLHEDNLPLLEAESHPYRRSRRS